MKTCENCIYWKRGDKGECHRHSPVQCLQGYAFDTSKIEGSTIQEFCTGDAKFVGSRYASDALTPIIRMGWPYTNPNDFCGDFEEKK